MKKISYLMFILLIMAGLLGGCAQKNEEIVVSQEPAATVEEVEQAADEETIQTQYPLTVTDKFGKEVVIEAKPQRVISFSPEDVEILYTLGAGGALVGRSTYCDYPEEALAVEDMGDLFNFNVENVVAATPDLVLLSSMADESLVQSLNEKGLNVLVMDLDTTLEGTYAYILTLGQIFDVQAEAEALIEDMKARIQAVNDQVKELEKPAVYFAVSVGEYDSAATGDTFIDDMITLAGGENIAADGVGWMYTVEQVVEKDPDLLICSKLYDFKAQIQAAEGYKDLRAVKDGEIYEVDENIFYRQGPRIVEAVETLAKIFHPEAF